MDSKCRLHNVKFYSCRSHGVYSYIYSNLHNYTFQSTRKVTGSTGETKVTNSTTFDYSTLKQVIDHKFEPVDVGKKRWKRQYSPLYFAVIVDIKFCLKNSRYATTKDSKSLLLLKNETLTKMNVPVDFLADDLLLKIVELRNVELMPVSAIMGGFLAQEAVKVITGKEVPFNNFFVFDATEQSTLLMTI